MLLLRAVRRLQKRLVRLMSLLWEQRIPSWEEEPAFRRVVFFARRVSKEVAADAEKLGDALRNRDLAQALAIASTLYDKMSKYLVFS